MKIAFICKDQEILSSGIKRKIDSQIKSLNKLGINARLIIIGHYETDCSSHQVVKPTWSNKYRIGQSTLLGRIINQFFYDCRLNQIINSMDAGEIAYFRYPFSWFFIPRFFSRRKRKCFVVCEFNSIMTDEPIDSNSRFNKIFRKLSLFFHDFTLKYIDGIVGVTDSITNHYLYLSGDTKKAHITITNGICVEDLEKRIPPIFNGRSIELLCVANIREWHGLDRLIEGLAQYRGAISFTIHIAGDGNKLEELKEHAGRVGVKNDVVFHGFINMTTLDDLYNQCHGAISSLGLHRIGLTEASPLKAREYCARGIPFISGTKDPDFSPSFPHILLVPSDDSFIDFNQIVTFIRNQYSYTDHQDSMRNYAITYLDWDVKMETLKNFLFELTD